MQTRFPINDKGDYIYRAPELAKSPGRFFLLAGPSGVGKGTVLTELYKDRDIQDRFSPLCALRTRAPRPGEASNAMTRFISREELLRMQAKGKLLEWTHYGKDLYGWSVENAQDIFTAGRHILSELSAEGVVACKKAYPGKVTGIFIAPPEPTLDILEKRLKGRPGSTPEMIQERLALAGKDLSLAPRFDTLVVNEEGRLAKTVADVKRFLLGQIAPRIRFAGEFPNLVFQKSA